MFVTRKKKQKQKNKKKQCKQDISIYHEQIKRLLSSVLMTLLWDEVPTMVEIAILSISLMA